MVTLAHPGLISTSRMTTALPPRKLLQDPIIGLRNLVAQKITLVQTNISSLADQGEVKTAMEVEKLIQRLGQIQLERINANGRIDRSILKERMRILGVEMNHGVEVALTGHGSPPQISALVDCATTSGPEGAANMLRGYFAATIMTGNAPNSIAALVEIGKLEGRNSTEVIQEHMPLILELRERFPNEVNKPIGEIRSGKQELALDKGMALQGFIWNPQIQTYVHMGGPTTPIIAAK